MQVTSTVAKATGNKGNKANKGQVSTGKGNKPATVAPAPAPAPANPFGAFVAQQVAQGQQASAQLAPVVVANTMPQTATAAHVQAHAGFVRPVQNGRKGYAPNTVGALIWATATSLQALTPGNPVTSAQVRQALPQVAPASVSAGLSHWRKFCGTLRVKGQPRAVALPVAPVALPVPTLAGSLALMGVKLAS